MDVVHVLESRAATVLAAAGDAVVGVRGGGRAGSGIVIAEGRVATNAHNLRSDTVRVTFRDGRTAAGTVTGADIASDLAVVEADTGDAPAITWGDAAAEPGTLVFGLANPGGRGLRISFGLISAVGQSFRGPRGRRIADSVEHTAPLPRGASGGPVTDAEGRLIGINTHRLGDGFYLALPASSDLRLRLDDLAAGRVREPRRLGVGVAPPHMGRALREAVGLEPREGLLVRLVEDGSPAAQAGVRVGDLLVTAGGRDLSTADDLHSALDALTNGRLELVVIRGSEEVALSVPFAEGTGAKA